MVEGPLSIAKLDRFAPLLLQDEGEVDVRLAFTRDEENRRVVSGRVQAELKLRCQRCMEPMDYLLDSSFMLGIVVGDEQARQLPQELEPLMVGEDDLDLWQAVEDELLLSLPPFPTHNTAECAPQVVSSFDPDAVDADGDVRRENPFKVLEGLKKKPSDSD